MWKRGKGILASPAAMPSFSVSWNGERRTEKTWRQFPQKLVGKHVDILWPKTGDVHGATVVRYDKYDEKYMIQYDDPFLVSSVKMYYMEDRTFWLDGVKWDHGERVDDDDAPGFLSDSDDDDDLPPPPLGPAERTLSGLAPPMLSRQMSGLGRELLREALARDGGGNGNGGGAARNAPVREKLSPGDTLWVLPEAPGAPPAEATVLRMARAESGDAYVKVEYARGGFTCEWLPFESPRVRLRAGGAAAASGPWAEEMAAAAAAEAAWLAAGATVDALDEYPGVKTGLLQRKWRVASVVRLGDGRDDARAAKVAWEGFASPKWDAWLPRHKLAPPGTHTRGGEAVFVNDDLGLAAAAGTRAAALPSFEQRLKARGLRVRRVSGDGACLFRSVAFQLWGEEGRHAEVRRATCDHVERHAAHFQLVVDGDLADYVARTRRAHVWGDHVEILAIAELYDRPVEVWSTENPIAEPQRLVQCAQLEAEYVQPLRLSYHGACHYNALVERAAPPPLPPRPPGSSVLREMREKECGGARASEGDDAARGDSKDADEVAPERGGWKTVGAARRLLKRATGRSPRSSRSPSQPATRSAYL